MVGLLPFKMMVIFILLMKKISIRQKTVKTYSVFKHHINFPHFNFNFLSIDKKGYLISKGLGLVYTFNNNEISRIDNSFDHRNKYLSSLFAYQNRIFSFGGYGLFTDKNNIIYFDDDAKEWF